MKPSPKGGKGQRREGKRKEELPEHILVSRHRLHDALSLGIRFCADKKRKWQCEDAEIMRHAVRLMSKFVGYLSSNTSQHPLIKDTVSDMLIAMEGILQSENNTILPAAADVTAKLFLNLGGSIRELKHQNLALPLSKLLSSDSTAVSISSAVALRCMTSALGLIRECKRSTAIWEAMKKAKAVESIPTKLKDAPVDHFAELAWLLREILQRWSESRYPAWNGIKVMGGPLTFAEGFGSTVLTSVIQLFSSLALCGDVAVLMLEREGFVSGMVGCMRSAQPASVRIQAFALARNLSRSEKGCNLLISSCCEPLVHGIMDAINVPSSSPHPRIILTDRIPLLAAACQATALTTRWPGDHHTCFWKLHIDRALHHLLLPVNPNNPLTSPDNLQAALYDNTPSNIRIHVWEILGLLSKHSDDSHLHRREEDSCHVDALIRCACMAAADAMFMRPSSKYYHAMTKSEVESVSRAVALMVFSPSKYISSRARDVLWGNVRKFGGDYLGGLVDKLRLRCVEYLEMMVDLSRLAFFSSLTQFHGLILERETLGTLLSIVDDCVSGVLQVQRSSMGSPKTCCWDDSENPKEVDFFLLYSLQSLSQLLSSVELAGAVDQSFFSTLKQIASNKTIDQDTRWYAAFCLSITFDFYGFPSRLGERMEGFIDGDVFTDLQLVFPNGETLKVHGAILTARCPALLPLDKLSLEGKSCSSESRGRQVIHLSSNVDRHALMKLLEYIYTGYCHVDDDMAKPLSILANRCSAKSLHQMLKRKIPRCGSVIPSCDFSPLMKLDGHPFSDIVLEAKDDEGTRNCSTCQSPLPHVHAHKIILISGSSYMRALFQSGMRESYSGAVKVPISLRALIKLVSWFYSGELPKLEFHCKWSHIGIEEQFLELLVYLELSWLAESWCLEDVHRESNDLVVSCVETTSSFPLKVVECAAALGQDDVVGAAVRRLGPLYPQLRDSGELDSFDEAVIRMLQSEYVHYSQETPPIY